jgi:hypothetical protein
VNGVQDEGHRLLKTLEGERVLLVLEVPLPLEVEFLEVLLERTLRMLDSVDVAGRRSPRPNEMTVPVLVNVRRFHVLLSRGLVFHGFLAYRSDCPAVKYSRIQIATRTVALAAGKPTD